LTLAGLEAEQAMLEQRIERFGGLRDPSDIWAALGIAAPQEIPMLDVDSFTATAAPYRVGA